MADAVVRHVVTFGRVLREVGLEVGPGRVADALRGLDVVDLTRQEDVYFALRQTLVARHDELDLFDRAFNAWFLRAPVVPPVRTRELPVEQQKVGESLSDASGGGEDEEMGDPLELGASGHELLRDKDFAEMTPDEYRRVRRLIAAIAGSRPLRASRRRRPDPRGDRLDMRRLIRASLRTGGDPVDRPYRVRKSVPRKLVVLCDVSGSMDAYARALVLFLHAAVGSGPGVEAFAFGTRLSRLTPELGTRDPESALEKCTEAVTDWGSGTRIGASLKEFNDLYGKRALSRGAVIVIVSDGWERQDPELVGREMARLARAAYAVVWVNPLMGNPEYQPLAGGMRAALPFIDRFLSGHNLRSLEELAAVLAGIERRHAA
ncbi:MAG: VWA domain-containing protein [Thermoleophilia bacterium]|nr:VWA domain-containing protein [Thermoleophilia bacterium]